MENGKPKASRLYRFRQALDKVMNGVFFFCGAVSIAAVVLITAYLVIAGLPAIREIGLANFLFGTEWASTAAEPKFGILPFILTSVWGMLGAALLGVPVGLMCAVYLSKVASKHAAGIVRPAVELLAGIPSVVYGLVGMLFFCQMLGFKTSLLSGGCTLVVMILPTIIRTTQESLKTVPQSYREGALGLGASKWHMIRTIVLPSSLDGIVTGCILAVGRIVGESAALLFTAGVGTVVASNMFAAFTRSGGSLSVALYMYVSERGEFDVGFAIAAILMVLVLCVNGAAKLAKNRLSAKKR